MRISAPVVPSQMHERIAKTSIGRRAKGLEINGEIPLLCVSGRGASRQFRLWRGGSFSLWGPQHIFKRGWHPTWAAPARTVRHYSIAPLRVGHGAQVALLRCPIPRDGPSIIPCAQRGPSAIDSTILGVAERLSGTVRGIQPQGLSELSLLCPHVSGAPKR
jgi:hypothetical protein